MASNSIYISNTWTAIQNGVIPGIFKTPEEFHFPTIKSTNISGKEQSWTLVLTVHNHTINKRVPITRDMLDSPIRQFPQLTVELKPELITTRGKVMDQQATHISSGKNIGKVNETNCVTQGFRDGLSRYLRHTKQRNSTTIEKFPPPMLVQKYKNTPIPEGSFIQPKFNGVRLVAQNSDRHVILYSRTGMEYPGLLGIRKELMRLFAAAESLDDPIPYLDGESYAHNKPLQWISGQSRRGDDELLKFFIFDCFWPQNLAVTAIDRKKYLDRLFSIFKSESIVRVPCYFVSNPEEVEQYTKSFIKNNYEGAIIRLPDRQYQYGYNNYHSPNVLKVKRLLDSEFRLVDFAQGKKGKDVGALIWICEVINAPNEDDKTFSVVPKNMTYAERYKMFECLSVVTDGQTRFERDFKGKLLTVEYPELSTKTGKPVQAKAVIVRTYEDSNDVMAQLINDCLK